MIEEKKTQTRVRIAFKISAKGIFQPDVTSEAESPELAIENLKNALARVRELAIIEGYSVVTS